ncbi:amidohydrolase family protein [Pleomorphovibrio marinus]|uniref:amidohydrolase family protein n=1 Tax=Pleomorphovibrio marinus TaxID=2164132 RepID=UPI000E0B11D6|nr:amidohydrolase family protein [Pleomorphovibrio marinus]
MKPTIFLFSIILICSCQSPDKQEDGGVAYVGGTIIDGSGNDPIPDGVLWVQDGRVVILGTKNEIDLPSEVEQVDVSGKVIVPGLINGHGHVGDVKGIEGGHYSRETLLDNLRKYAQYGITTVVSLGGDREEAVPLRHLNDTIPDGRSRLFIAGEVITGNTPEEALEVVQENHEMGVDFMKIRVDDNLGTSSKMKEEVYRSIINKSHELGYQIPTHMYYLEDSKKLLDAGSDLLAHSIRDKVVDQEFVQYLKQKGVGYCPTLTRELSTFVYEDTASFFSDPFFLKVYSPEEIQPLLDPKRQEQVRNNRNAQIYKQQLPVAYENLKILYEAGVPIVFGTDSGVPTRFIGYFEHLEMEMMAEAGMDAKGILMSATSVVARELQLKDLGLLEPGYWADFLVLEANPLENIRNFRRIVEVYIGGVKLKDTE